MMDFIEHGSRDPQLYVNYSRSYFNFAATQEETLQNILSKTEVKLLELFSNEIANTKRIEEVIILSYSRVIYDKLFNPSKYIKGFVVYRKYSRKDVFRILNWAQNPVAQNVGGYIVSSDKTNCPIFVTYHKDENISATTKY